MDYEALEQELVNRLNAYFTDKGIEAQFGARRMPENDDEYKRVGSKPFVNVHYADSSFDKPTSTSAIHQTETITISFYVQARQLRGENGAHKLIGHINTCILGYRPQNARTRMFISGYGDWQAGDEGEINPFIQMQFDTLLQQQPEAEISFGQLKSIDPDYQP